MRAKMHPPLYVKDLQQENSELKAEIAWLEARVETLKEEVNSLREPESVWQITEWEKTHGVR